MCVSFIYYAPQYLSEPDAIRISLVTFEDVSTTICH